MMVIVCHHGSISGSSGGLANVEEQKIDQVMFRSIKVLGRSSLRTQRVRRCHSRKAFYQIICEFYILFCMSIIEDHYSMVVKLIGTIATDIKHSEAFPRGLVINWIKNFPKCISEPSGSQHRQVSCM